MADSLIGPLPANWEATTLGDVCARGGGDIQTGPFGSQLHASDYVPVGVPSIMPQNIGDNRIVTDGVARISEADAARLQRYLVRPGDIVYSRRGDVERRALIREEQDGWLCGTGCLRVRLGQGVVGPAFAAYYLSHPAVRAWVVQHAVGATMPNLNTTILAAVPFVIPPVSEQGRIADTLGALDDKIELNRRMNRSLESIARAVFKSWFVDFDPVYANGEGRDVGLPEATASLFPDCFEDSELGRIPTGWRIGPVLGVARLLSGGTPKTGQPEYWNGGIPWASAKDVSQCGASFLLETERTISERGLDESATQMIPALCSVVVARGATTGRMAALGGAMAMNQTCYALSTLLGTPFLLYCQLRDAIDDIVHAAHGSVFDTITTGTFEKSSLVLPPAKLCAKFEEVVDPLFRRVLAGTRESRDLAALRDALVPRLLSGELRVRDSERLIQEATA